MDIRQLSALVMCAAVGTSGCYGRYYVRGRANVYATTPQVYASAPAVVTVNAAPPPPRVVAVRPAPPQGYGASGVWIEGYWHADGGQWVWVDGHWEARRHRRVWTPPAYANGQYYPGYWRDVDEAPPPVYVQPTYVQPAQPTYVQPAQPTYVQPAQPT